MAVKDRIGHNQDSIRVRSAIVTVPRVFIPLKFLPQVGSEAVEVVSEEPLSGQEELWYPTTPSVLPLGNRL